MTYEEIIHSVRESVESTTSEVADDDLLEDLQEIKGLLEGCEPTAAKREGVSDLWSLQRADRDPCECTSIPLSTVWSLVHL